MSFATVHGRATRTFAPEPVSARDARHFLRAFLLQHRRGDLVDAAQTALAEVVTNAVLHAHTEFEVAAVLAGDGGLRVEVSDRNPHRPAQRAYGERATTGRGMQLVAAVAADCGVERRGADGKTVWFVVRGEDDDVLHAVWHEQPGADVAAAGGPSVVLLGLPPALWLAARQHHDAVLREAALHAQAHPRDAPPPERVAMADHARGLVSAAVVAAVQERSRSLGSAAAPSEVPVTLVGAPPPLDLVVPLPAGSAPAYVALQEVLDHAERLAAAGALLARPALPEVVAVRDWVCDQVVAQDAGAVPSAWHDPVDDRRVPVPLDAGPGADDLDEVSRDSRNVAAADDTNRILAVSRPLAQLLGWAGDDLVGRRITALVPPELHEAHIAGFSRHLTTGETHILGVPVRLPVRRADGSRLDCRVRIEQRRSSAGRQLYVAWFEPVA